MDIIPLEIVDSTNTFLKELSKNLPEEGTVVVAGEQTAGKGQRGNSWESEPGKNITCSILLYPSFLPMKRHFLLSEAISVSILDTLKVYTESLYSDDFTIKWPNDIYYKDKKIAGILIENEISGNVFGSSVAGIGLNVNQEQFLSKAPNPVSLKQITGSEWDLETFLKELIQNILQRYGQLKAGDADAIIATYHDALYRKTGFHSFVDKQGTVCARIVKVSDDGLLHLITDGGEERTYDFKTVRFA